MTVSLVNSTIFLSGICGVDEVEALIGHLESQPGSIVDLSEAISIHTALWQALLVYKPAIRGTPVPESTAGTIFPAIAAHLQQNHDESA
ncbi:hypothetical protein ASG42_21960 [Rhizobium sp. Leaf391]|uniref:hypothetical protein n=1 Tax=Rhizobium sp. Leaf391 TaxID=1736360 RepID=UPI000715D969|nr:hypothetical protein [Rhizobium sp. Leaf391]KQT05176.1 hypothetical protein ASG42_21960 [Rhizobium sp. Leaf391]